MKIAVIGSGNVGTALGDGWSGKGHDVVYGSRSPEKESGKDRKFASIADAIAQSEVVALAVPWDAVESVLSSNDLSGKAGDRLHQSDHSEFRAGGGDDHLGR